MNINDYIRRKSQATRAPQMTPEEAVAKYAGMDEAELMSELFKAAEQAYQPVKEVSEEAVWI